jgi:hypothetical protein
MAVGGRVSRRLSPSRNGPAGAMGLGRVRPATCQWPISSFTMIDGATDLLTAPWLDALMHVTLCQTVASKCVPGESCCEIITGQGRLEAIK